jgi:hypothetical protein
MSVHPRSAQNRFKVMSRVADFRMNIQPTDLMERYSGFILSGKHGKHGKVREFKVIWKTHGKVREISKKKQYFNVFLENYKF